MNIETAHRIVEAIKDHGEAYVSRDEFANKQITLDGPFTAEQLIAIATLMQAGQISKTKEAA